MSNDLHHVVCQSPLRAGESMIRVCDLTQTCVGMSSDSVTPEVAGSNPVSCSKTTTLPAIRTLTPTSPRTVRGVSS
jgi:hypothetical protein